MGGVINKGASVVTGGVKKTVEAGKDVAGKVADTGKDVAEKGVDLAKDGVKLSGEALEWRAKQELNFGKGVLEWGKGNVDTVKGIVTNPVDTLKAVDSLASNPLLNPVGGLVRGALEGKNPIESYKDGAEQLGGIGKSLANDYKEQYDKNGAAGVAGYIAPDIALAILTGGSGTAAKETGKAAAKGIAKDVAKEVAPGPEDIVDKQRKQQESGGGGLLQGLQDTFGGLFS